VGSAGITCKSHVLLQMIMVICTCILTDLPDRQTWGVCVVCVCVCAIVKLGEKSGKMKICSSVAATVCLSLLGLCCRCFVGCVICLFCLYSSLYV